MEADIELAIGYCIQNNILKDFLEKHRGEVVESMAMDFTFERQLELEVADARDEARAEGRTEGRAEGLAEGVTEGRAEERAEWQKKAKKINMLTQLLIKDKRIDDLARSTEDEDFRTKLMKEYQIY